MVRALLDDLRAAYGAGAGHRETALAAFVLLRDALDDGGNHVPRPLDAHCVPHADVLLGDLAGVVQRGAAYRDAAHVDRAEQGHRRELARAADLDDDILDDRHFLARLELERDRPARRAGPEPEYLAVDLRIDLYHDAVDLEGELVAGGGEGAVERDRLLDRAADLHVRIDAEPPAREDLELVRMRVGGLGALERHDLVREKREGPPGRYAGVELPERSGRRVSRIGEGGELPLRHPAVEIAERLERHDRLAADRDEPGGFAAAEPERHRPDRADVRRDVLAHGSVAARRAARENAVFVDELDREPVELGLHRVCRVVRAESLLHPLIELARVGDVHHRLEAQHRLHVADVRKVVAGRGADPLRRRVARDEIGEFPFELLELRAEPVVRLIRNLRLVEDVVEMIVPRDFLAKPADPLFDFGAAHRDPSLLSNGSVLKLNLRARLRNVDIASFVPSRPLFLAASSSRSVGIFVSSIS